MKSKPRLETSIQTHLSPVFRADGFRGSGRTFVRVVGDMIHVVNIQGARDGGSFAINLAIQPLAVSDEIGRPVDPKKMTHSVCRFRRRLSVTGGDQWWFYEESQESMDAAMKSATEAYLTAGRSAFSKFMDRDSPLHTVTALDFDTDNFDFLQFCNTKRVMAQALSELRAAQGNQSESDAFAAISLKDDDAHQFAARLPDLLATVGARTAI